jgi:hypothetical protein
MNFTGLAQKTPNIDLARFVGETVLIKLNKYKDSLGGIHIGKLVIGSRLGTFEINGFIFTEDGKRYYNPTEQWITEIYGEDAFRIELKDIIDPEVETALKVIKSLTKDQLKEVLSKYHNSNGN